MSDPWWKRKKKRSRGFSDIYDELEKLGAMIDETIEKTFEVPPKKPSIKTNRIQSFYLKIGPNGKPWIREINNRKSVLAETEINEALEPLIDLIDNGNSMDVLVTLPGISKDDIDLRVTKNSLRLTVSAAEFEWTDEFELPVKVKPKSARASYKNGVLKVHLEKFEKTINDNNTIIKK